MNKHEMIELLKEFKQEKEKELQKSNNFINGYVESLTRYIEDIERQLYNI